MCLPVWRLFAYLFYIMVLNLAAIIIISAMLMAQSLFKSYSSTYPVVPFTLLNAFATNISRHVDNPIMSESILFSAVSIEAAISNVDTGVMLVSLLVLPPIYIISLYHFIIIYSQKNVFLG